MSQRTDLLQRLTELDGGTDANRSAARSIQKMINHGEYSAASTAMDDLETALHPALAAAGPGGSSVVLLKSTNVASADLLTLETIPVELIAAPGGRNYIQPLHAVCHLRAGATPYAVGMGGYFVIGWGTSTSGPNTLYQRQSIYSPVFTSAVDAYMTMADDADGNAANGSFGDLTKIEDVPLTLWSQGAALTSGNGTLVVRVWYSVIDGAP